MPPRSFSTYQPVRSHAFVDFGLSGGLEGLRWSRASSADPTQFADTIVDRSTLPPSKCNIELIRASKFPDQTFTPPSHNDVRALLATARKRLHDFRRASSSGHRDTDLAVASIPQAELLSLGQDSTKEWVREWSAGCNSSSSLAVCEISGTPHLLWTTGSNGQFLMCSVLDIAGAVADPSSALNASLPAFDCSSIPTSTCFTHQRISDIEVIRDVFRYRCSCSSNTSFADCCSASFNVRFCQVIVFIFSRIFHFITLSVGVAPSFNFTTCWTPLCHPVAYCYHQQHHV
jgi:hypothetical protein